MSLSEREASPCARVLTICGSLLPFRRVVNEISTEPKKAKAAPTVSIILKKFYTGLDSVPRYVVYLIIELR